MTLLKEQYFNGYELFGPLAKMARSLNKNECDIAIQHDDFNAFKHEFVFFYKKIPSVYKAIYRSDNEKVYIYEILKNNSEIGFMLSNIMSSRGNVPTEIVFREIQSQSAYYHQEPRFDSFDYYIDCILQIHANGGFHMFRAECDFNPFASVQL